MDQITNNWHKLSSLVDMTCDRVGLDPHHYFQKFLGWAKWELIQLKLDRANEPKTVLLPVSDNYTCLLPPDAIDWTKIGFQDGQFVKTIGINGDLSRIDRADGVPDFSRSVSPGWLPNGTAIQEYAGGFEFLNYGGRSIYAVGGGLPHEGHFQVRKKGGSIEILLDGNLSATEIYCEYISLGINPCAETVLDPYIADYIMKATLAIWETEMNPHRTEASIARREKEKAHAFALVSGRTNSIDKDTLLLITRRAYRLTNKV